MKLFSNLQEDLRDWFSKTSPHGDWKRINSKGEAIGPCAREPGEPKPKCMSKSMRASLSKKEKASAVRRKRKEDPNAERQGPPINVNSKVNENMEQLDEKNKPTNPELWSRAIAQAKSKFDVYPSAYANGWASKWYKEKGGGWKTVSEDSEVKSNLKTFKQISELVKPDVKNDLNSLDKISFVKKHGLTKSVARQKLTTEAKEKTEYDYEGDMARGQLQSIISNAQRVHDMLKDDTNIAEWVQSKITLAEDYISTVANYMMSELDESSYAAVRMAKALQRAKEQREREERAGAALLKPKPKNEEVEQQDEAMSHQAATTMKHIPNASPALKKAAKDIKPGVGGYRDRIDMLNAGGVKKEEVMVEREDDEYHTPSRHHVQVQVSKGDGPKEHRKATVRAKEPQHAVSAAISHYKQQGYTVHDHKYLGEETIQEGRPSQRHPLEGHEYHKKSNDALVHIAKDAHAAAEAMKSHNTTAENKYRDQANDSATVRHFRKTSGMPDWYKKKYGHVKEGVVNEVMDEPNYKNSIQARQKKADDANKPPFDGPYTTRPSTVTDKSGAKHSPMSRVRDLARAAAKRQAQKMPVKEGLEESRKAEIVKEIMKKGKKKEDNSFQAEPVIGSTVVKADN